MKRTNVSPGFRKIYFLFGSSFLFLLILLFIANIYQWYPFLLYVSVAIAVDAGVCVYLIRRNVLKLFKTFSVLIDHAIEGNNIPIECNEMEISLVTSKLARFTKVRNKEIENSKQQKQRIEGLISDISHQTKTSIANILLYSKLLEENVQDLQKTKKYVTHITKHSEKLKWLIQTMLHMSRLENDIIQCDIKHHRVEDLILLAINQTYKAAEKKGIEIDYIPSNQSADFDLKWTGEALTNILDNSVKYTNPNGQITIHVNEFEHFLCITITDNGIGIPKEEQAQIFQRFYRGTAVSTHEGIGVGLYLARKIITIQKGYIKVDSAYGKGAKFHVYIPKKAK